MPVTSVPSVGTVSTVDPPPAQPPAAARVTELMYIGSMPRVTPKESAHANRGARKSLSQGHCGRHDGSN